MFKRERVPEGGEEFYPPRREMVDVIARVMLYALIAPVAALVLALLAGVTLPLGLLIVAAGFGVTLLAGVITFFVHQNFYRPRLVLSPRGLLYESRRIRIHAPWELLEAVGDRQTAKDGPIYEGLILHRQESPLKEPHEPMPYFIEPTRFIPLERFNEHWRNSSIGRMVLQYAPTLFPDTPEKQ